MDKVKRGPDMKKGKRGPDSSLDFIWASMPGMPSSVLWPVKRIRVEDGKIEVFCKSDNAEITLKPSAKILPFPGDLQQWQKKGESALKKKSKTLRAFHEDVDWAMMCKHEDTPLVPKNSEDTSHTPLVTKNNGDTPHTPLVTKNSEDTSHTPLVTKNNEDTSLVAKTNEDTPHTPLITKNSEDTSHTPLVTKNNEDTSLVTKTNEDTSLVTKNNEDTPLVITNNEDTSLVTKNSEGTPHTPLVTKNNEDTSLVTKNNEDTPLVITNKLSKYLITEIGSLDLTNWDYSNVKKTAVLTLARLTLYNRRRCHEVQALRVDVYNRRKAGVDEVALEMLRELTPFENELLKRQEMVEIRGKTGRGVPVILPADTLKPLQFLANPDVRATAGIQVTNPYLFANSLAGVFRAYDAIRNVSIQAGLVMPQLVRTSNMRKYMATMLQVMNTVMYQAAAQGKSRKIQPQQQPQESETKSGAQQIKRQPKITKHVAKRDVDLTDESDSDKLDSKAMRKGKKTSRPAYKQAAASAKGKKESRSNSTASGGQNSEDGARVSVGRATRSKSPGNRSSTRRKTSPEKQQSINGDKQRREDIQSTYVDLMQELELERERRWKAEQAARKLIDHIKELQTKAKQDNDVKDAAIEATSHLKQAVMNEKEAKQRLQQELRAAKEEGESLSQLLTSTREGREASLQSARTLEETSAQREREWMKQQAHDQKKLQEAQMKAAALGRELDLLRNSETSVRGQVQQLQALLASREQEHCKDLQSRYSLESNEIQMVIQRELDKERKHHTQELKCQQDRIEQLSRQYADLEDEFRYALHVESSRFKELKDAFERCSNENSENKLALRGTQKKEESSASMVAEMTSLVKEQKGRISELSKSKQEQIAEYRSRIQTLEAHVEEARKRMVQLELTKQEKSKLEAQVQAQSSLIEGMKAEKHLWGQELAQQGSSLAQDRGRLEGKIETLSIEVVTLKKQLEREVDNVKIKTKVVDDQTETIRKLKEGLLECDEDIKRTREESVKVQKQLEEQIAEERSAGQDSQELVDRLQDRKEDLKQHLADIQAELEESKRAHGILNNRWKEKSELIGQLEQQVRQMKESWDTKEAKLTKERDKAVEAASDAVGRIKSTDEAFRKQLDAKQCGHQDELQRIEQDREMELGQANHRIISVENEMRELLRESQANKKAMEEKVKRLTRAFSDIQADLS